jgi:hypothetical protein
VASAALQQFISGQSLRLSRKNDSLAAAGGEKEQGENVGDLWKMQNGPVEEILEVGREPCHKVVLSNEYV